MENKCISCQSSIVEHSDFCQYCGAPIKRERLSFRVLLSDFYKTIFNLDTPFLKTLKLLVTKPEEVTLSFIDGVRKVISSPVKFTLIIMTIYGVFQFLFSDFLDLVAQKNFLSGFEAGFNSEGEEAIIGERITVMVNWMQKHNQFLNFFFIPVMAIINLGIYKKNKLNFAEHASIALYAISFSILISIVLGVLCIPFSDYINMEIYIVLSGLLQFVSVLWILHRSLKGNILRGILSYLISFILLSVSFVLVILTVMLLTMSGL